MSDYTQVNDYSAKDALSSGDPSKKILGADIDAELAAISTAIATKANDSATVHNTGTESIAGDKTFSGNVTNSGTVTMSGKSLWFAEGADVASAATADIWTTDGNTLHVTGTTGISSFGTAPQAGAWKLLIFDGAVTLTHGANLNLPDAADYTTYAGQMVLVYADTTTQFDVFPIYPRAYGNPTGGDKGAGTLNAASGFYENGNKVGRGLTWLETLSPSASTGSTFATALTPGKRYRVTGSMKVSSTDILGVRFNGDSGTNYGSIQNATDQTPANTPLASAGSTQIIVSSGGAANDTIMFSFEFETESGDDTRVQVDANSTRINAARTAYNRFSGGGFYDGAAALSSVTVFNYNAAGTETGKLRLYVYEE